MGVLYGITRKIEVCVHNVFAQLIIYNAILSFAYLIAYKSYNIVMH